MGYFRERTQEMYEAAKERLKQQEKRRAALAELNVQEVAEDEVDNIGLVSRVTTNEKVEKGDKVDELLINVSDILELNKDQREIFEDVKKEISEREVASKKDENDHMDKILFVSGFG